MKKFKRLRKTKKGMTLVELVVAITLISIVFASAMSGIVHGYMSVVKNKNVEQASMQAKGVADKIVSGINDILNNDNITDKDAEIKSMVQKQSPSVSFYKNGVLNQIDNNFPQATNGTNDIQVAVTKMSNVEVAKDGALNKQFNGYKVYVATACSGSSEKNSFITVTATSMYK
ncbi:type II secretion system protein [Candidatus Pseudoruminococcus sp.]|uniref:type II secretion system protein n=1 Tax=Candidatus Pseudoruminococcus sp. TaxID=3101048 RepID=UPI00399AF0B4